MKERKYICYWLFIVGYYLLVNYSPSSIFNLRSDVVAAETNKTILNNLASMADPNSNYKKKLLRIELNMPEDNKEEITSNELRKIIEQIRSIDVGISKEVLEPVSVPGDVPKNEPNEAVVKKNIEEGQKEKKVVEQKPSNGIITTQTLEILMTLSHDPNNLENPFELGETLFLSGYIKEAVIFYREAIRRKSSEKTDSVQDKAWILFQIGNCLKDDNKPEAIKAYVQLIKEYPDSPWKELAEVRKALIDWQLKEDPGKLIKERMKND